MAQTVADLVGPDLRRVSVRGTFNLTLHGNLKCRFRAGRSKPAPVHRRDGVAPRRSAERRLFSRAWLYSKHGELVPGPLDDAWVGMQVVRQGATGLVDRCAAATSEGGVVDT